MSSSGESTIDARVRAVEKEYLARQTRLFVTFALIEGPLLLVGAVLIYGLKLVEPDVGVWFILAVALIGGFVLSALLLRLIQGRARAVAQARGENPLF
ncbi:hypothetical protein [Streptomyces sp. AC495_CC817]|uniref:hypothetical protein n=1 Tax=Streptomyces sp. AC495_CC817 TaxID=2823900 RepID=UPI001C272B9E|nr:hypothetical protein [Streptomyces sp. AC495_CC817]